jgi:hypothetical protein
VSALDDVALVIGPDAARILAERFGGVNHYIGRDADGPVFEAFATAIGRLQAEALFSAFAGETLCLPRLHSDDLEARRRKVRELRALGLSVAEIAARFTYRGRYTQRQIYRLLSEPADSDICHVGMFDETAEDCGP